MTQHGVRQAAFGGRRRLTPEELKQAWRTVDQLRERNADRDPDEALEDITRLVEDVRTELNGERPRI